MTNDDLIRRVDDLAVVEGAVNIARAAIAECENWSAVQGEWSRARDLGLDIADSIAVLAAVKGNPA